MTEEPKELQILTSFEELNNVPITENSLWFAIDKKWLDSFYSFARGLSPNVPGPIDNRPIFFNLINREQYI